MSDQPRHPGGRPTKYTPELLEKSYEYLGTYEELGDEIPSHIGLFLFIGITDSCGYAWGKEEGKEEFSRILRKCFQMQHQVLVNKGLNGKFNPNIAKLVLGKHGLHDKQEVNNTVSLTDLSSDELDRKIKQLELTKERALSD